MSGDSDTDDHIEDVLAAYGHEPGAASAVSIAGGLINQTYRVADADGATFAVLQKLHPVFGPEVNEDIDAVTSHLAAAGIETPRLIRTPAGAAWVEADGGVWRMLSWLDGITVHAIHDLDQAEAAAEKVGAFHSALRGFDHDFVHVRAGVHDTRAHLHKLRERVAESREDDWADEAVALGQEILAAARDLPALHNLPLRVCHGDLKISNVLFGQGTPWAARCLIDLDTLGRQTMAYELGDAMRSWCNPAGEDVAAPRVDAEILRAAMQGYRLGAPGLLEPQEIKSIVPGLETVCVELAARFCVDVFDDSYFGWDAERFATRRDHNLMRARGQLALGRSATEQRERLTSVARRALTRRP